MLKTQLAIAAITGWILLNCIFVGGYKIYTEYLNWLPETLDPHEFVSSLTTEERNILAEAVMGYQEAKEAPKVKR